MCIYISTYIFSLKGIWFFFLAFFHWFISIPSTAILQIHNLGVLCFQTFTQESGEIHNSELSYLHWNRSDRSCMIKCEMMDLACMILKNVRTRDSRKKIGQKKTHLAPYSFS